MTVSDSTIKTYKTDIRSDSPCDSKKSRKTPKDLQYRQNFPKLGNVKIRKKLFLL